jgi:peptide/nickel transport system ATP-binding protein
MLGLDSPTSGAVEYLGRDVTRLSRKETTRFRRGIQAVFQDPTASLNPYMTVSEIVGEAWEIHPDVLPPQERPENIRRLLEQVGLEPGHAARYPHQFSGGQRQRIAIARALAIRPQVIVCDEAVSALDVSIQAQIIQLLKDLRKQHQLSLIFIAHDLNVVRDLADRVLVMHKGRVVEQGTTEQIFGSASHDYTRELLAASLPVKVSVDAS